MKRKFDVYEPSFITTIIVPCDAPFRVLFIFGHIGNYLFF